MPEIMKKTSWTFLTNHSHVIVCLVRDPEMRVRIVQGDGSVSADRVWTLTQLGGGAAE